MIGLLLKKLRGHLPSTAAYYAAFVLLIGLEILTGAAIIWHFILRDILPVPPMWQAIAGGIYTAMALTYLLINLTGSMLCFKIQGFLYISVALFFLLKGFLLLQSREFNPWGFYILWVALLIVSARETIVEVGPDLREDE